MRVCHKLLLVNTTIVVVACGLVWALDPRLAVMAFDRSVVLATGLVLAAIAMSGYASAWILVRPINRLTRATLRIAAGENASIEPYRSRDEIGQLVGALRKMIESLGGLQTRLCHFAEASSDWLWETDPELRLTYLSGRFAETSGLAVDEVLGWHLRDLVEPQGASEMVAFDAAFDVCEPIRNLLCRYRSGAGEWRVCRLAGQPVRDSAGRFLGYRGTATDVTREFEAQARAQYLALHDPLTDLPNRVLLTERIEQAATITRRRGTFAAVLCIDLDHFKEVNDTLGHTTGDLLLQEVAKRLRGLTREIDTVARLGGDEFAIVQTEIASAVDAEKLCQRLLEGFAQPVMLEHHAVFVGISIGVAVAPFDGEEPQQLLKGADIALYRAKAEGRGTFRFFEPEMDAKLQARKALERDLREALARNELELYYQPQIDLATGRIDGVEALLRWRHPIRGPISPAEFIPVAETTGLILPLGEWVLRTACTQAVQWPSLRIAVNVSPTQFRQTNFADMVARVLAETGTAPERLEIEITEGVLLHETETTFATLRILKALGVRIAMDDFGTGYSSLSYLRRFPFDKIKIDRSFVTDLGHEADADAIIRAVVTLGRTLGMKANAEGVETAEQALRLRAEGCDEVQGYHFGRPMTAADVTRRLESEAPAAKDRLLACPV